jgi:hypothetical protein
MKSIRLASVLLLAVGLVACSSTKKVPVIASFTATPATINVGSASTLAWTVTDADTLQVNGVAVTGTSKSVSPTTTTTYTLTATAAGGSVSATATVTVNQLPVIASFLAVPDAIVTGDHSTLTWGVTGATSLSIDHGVGTVTGTSVDVSPTATTTYTLTATNGAGDVTATATVTVNAQPTAPSITSFSAAPVAISQGSATTLSWVVSGATSLSIDQGVGTVTGTSKSVSPMADVVYTLSATNAVGTTTATVSVTVTGAFGCFTGTPTTHLQLITACVADYVAYADVDSSGANLPHRKPDGSLPTPPDPLP